MTFKFSRIELARDGESAHGSLLCSAETEPSPWVEVEVLQQFPNTLPGIDVKVDGWTGPRTSEASHKLVGHHLLGDPRDSEHNSELCRAGRRSRVTVHTPTPTLPLKGGGSFAKQ